MTVNIGLASVYSGYRHKDGFIRRINAFLKSVQVKISRTVLSADDGCESRHGSLADTDAINANAANLMDRYGNMILRLAYSYLHNNADAEDILQDTLIQYIKTAPVFNGPEHEKAWMLHVAANLSKNKINYNRLRDTDELDEELAAGEHEDLAFVWEAVKSLPDKFSEVIHLFYYEGYSTSEISEIIGRKEVTVRSDLHRARELLKNKLKEAYDFEG